MKEAVYKWEIVDDLLIAFGTSGPISDRDWDGFFKQLQNPQVKRHLGATIGAIETNSVQRKAASNVLKVRKIPVVVVTSASIVRGIVTAVSWLGVDIKAFDWPDLQKGMDSLGVTGSQQDRAVEILLRMKANNAAR